MIRKKTYKILTTPGLSIFGVNECKDCVNLTFENTCKKWAFPETKWRKENDCVDYTPVSGELKH